MGARRAHTRVDHFDPDAPLYEQEARPTHRGAGQRIGNAGESTRTSTGAAAATPPRRHVAKEQPPLHQPGPHEGPGRSGRGRRCRGTSRRARTPGAAIANGKSRSSSPDAVPATSTALPRNASSGTSPRTTSMKRVLRERPVSPAAAQLSSTSPEPDTGTSTASQASACRSRARPPPADVPGVDASQSGAPARDRP